MEGIHEELLREIEVNPVFWNWWKCRGYQLIEESFLESIEGQKLSRNHRKARYRAFMEARVFPLCCINSYRSLIGDLGIYASHYNQLKVKEAS